MGSLVVMQPRLIWMRTTTSCMAASGKNHPRGVFGRRGRIRRGARITLRSSNRRMIMCKNTRQWPATTTRPSSSSAAGEYLSASSADRLSPLPANPTFAAASKSRANIPNSYSAQPARNSTAKGPFNWSASCAAVTSKGGTAGTVGWQRAGFVGYPQFKGY